MKNMQKGFTLIELMIVVAIIAILAAIAIPAYQDYLVRSQVSEGAVLADGAKTAIAEYYSNTGSFPGTNLSAGLAPKASIVGKYVSSVGVGATDAGANGVIKVTYGNSANTAIAGKFFSLSAITHAGSIEWSCKNTSYTTVAAKYLPTSCR
ncbi:MAG: prepilin-type N-terminal cleavage/methylation domain-containing protein [Proteobacteria bacterium]|nr:prepilin-type N-terminal cleavage/methylation domain-containing protein [Pseudomonadota bacterium]